MTDIIEWGVLMYLGYGLVLTAGCVLIALVYYAFFDTPDTREPLWEQRNQDEYLRVRCEFDPVAEAERILRQRVEP